MHKTATLLLALTLTAGIGMAQDAPLKRSYHSDDEIARVEAVTRPTVDFSKPETFEVMQGGAGTTRKIVNADAFSHSMANLTFADEETFKLGNGLFRKLWVSAPSSTQASDGLGPLFNARACQSCHLKDGRGHPPENGETSSVSMFLRLSVPPQDGPAEEAIARSEVKTYPEPVYGGQLQESAVPGLAGEGRMVIEYSPLPVTLGDGTVVELRAPNYAIADLGYGPMADDVLMSPRVSPQMIGLGLLEAIAAEDIVNRQDADDWNGDGISGRANYATDPKSGTVMLGRFGWKAGAPTIMAQSADAFAGDIGISTPLHNTPYGDCTESQTACLQAATGEQERLGVSEAPDPVLDLVTRYSQTLGVPARRDVDDPAVLRGKAAFYGAGCIACHTPKFVTSREAPNKAHQFQLIWPYTDLLLHDMGEGLADHRPEGLADGYEWRTPPLWGIGLTETVSGHTYFLHDGRARNLTEAILWHGGEAQMARDSFADMTAEERADLIRFLESL